jgi:hypothetical protein
MLVHGAPFCAWCAAKFKRCAHHITAECHLLKREPHALLSGTRGALRCHGGVQWPHQVPYGEVDEYAQIPIVLLMMAHYASLHDDPFIIKGWSEAARQAAAFLGGVLGVLGPQTVRELRNATEVEVRSLLRPDDRADGDPHDLPQVLYERLYSQE